VNEVPKSVAQSVHARLYNGAEQRREDFNLTLQRYVAERFLYRLGASVHRDRLVLKGAMLFALWSRSLYRATRDLDLAGHTKDDAASLIAIMKDICSVPCPGDGLAFEASTMRAEPILDRTEYRGTRVKLVALLGTARVPLQIDVGLGDAIDPPARIEEYPVLLDGPAPRIRAYPREAAIAEKAHAMVTFGIANSRHKDFYDVFVLATHFEFSGAVLTRALASTFERRATPITGVLPVAFTAPFYAEPARAAEWRRYLSRMSLEGAPADFVAVGERIAAFLAEPWRAIADGDPFPAKWPAAGPWRPFRTGEEHT